jgi:hypothetical protein
VNEAYIRKTLNHDLKEYGYWNLTGPDAMKCNKCGNLYRPPGGLPDSPLLHPVGRSIFVEYKVLKGISFSFDRIDEKQAKWMDDWSADSGLGYLGMAVVKAPDKDNKYHVWLEMYMIDWEYWSAVEDECRQHGSLSIPYTWHNRARVPEQLDIAHKFSAFRMYRSKGQWKLPPHHTAIP